jgi:hypothetical protein
LPNLISTFRDELIADLAVRFPDADIHSGFRDAPARDRDRIAVYWTGTVENIAYVQQADAQFVVRYWPRTPIVRNESTDGIRDPEALEQAAWDLADFLQAKQTAYSGAWFCRFTGVIPDYDEWRVDGTLVLPFNNPAVV